MLFVCHPKILHKHCLQFLLGVKMAPRETENNAYAKFWGDKQRALWYVMVFSGAVNIGGEQLQSDTEIATALNLQHTLHLRIDMDACSYPHKKLAHGLSLTMRPTKTKSLLWKFSPLGYSGPFWGTFSKIRLHVHYRRSKDWDGSRFFREAFIGGNNFVFNPEANSLLFREFLPWLKQHPCMMPRKLRKSNNSLMFITDHDENSFDQQQQ